VVKRVIDVNTGQIGIARGNGILRSVALGSCIAVVAYDVKKKIGAIAHIMLPGTAPADSEYKNRYASNAVAEVLAEMAEAGSQNSDIEVCMVGAGNVLEKEDDTVCTANIKAVTKLLNDNNIPIRASVIGGIERKSVFLDIQTGSISYTQGSSQKNLLWQPSMN